MSVADKGKSPDSLAPAGKNKRRFLSAEKKYLMLFSVLRRLSSVIWFDVVF